MARAVILSVSVFLLLSFTLCLSVAFSQSPSLIEGIKQYKEEKYEQAVEILVKARKEDPKSSVAAFFLGLAYKQIMDYPKALKEPA